MTTHQPHVQAKHLKNTILHDCVVVPTTLDPTHHTAVARLPSIAPVPRGARSSLSRPSRKDYSSLVPTQTATEEDPPDNTSNGVANNDGDELMRDVDRNSSKISMYQQCHLQSPI